MAEIAAFKGIRYNESAVGSLDKVTSPPYDIISPEDRVYYHKLHPNNFVRLILGEEFEGDNESDNRFTRAKRYLDQWLKDGVLVQDNEPSIYIYEQHFERDGSRVVRGITCAVKIHPYSDKVILPHENTLAKPKSQLGRLIREAKANLDCVYGLYADEAGVLDEVMARAMSQAPVADVRDKDEVRHILWALSDPTEIAAIVDYLKDKPIAIADGHHRYETALAYRDEMREKSGGGEELPSDYTLMTIANVYQKDMTIFPTHRVLANIAAELLGGLDGKLTELFEVCESSRESLLPDMTRLGAIGMYRKCDARTLKLKADPGSLLSGSEASRKLELNVLHKLILEPALGIDDDKLRNQTHIIYTRTADEAMDLVDSGERQIAFLLNHIAVKSVLDVASAGEKMPQKATYFYPKLLSGLVLRVNN
ncbi:MAG: DUF1015 domain-containing protein [Armatimonadetes bacterium]|nr:DUF1015 domain-containing protein [Armatimonadota bacterium]